MTSIDVNEHAPLAFYDSTESWQAWFESRLAEEREYTSALIAEVVRGLVADLNACVDKAVVEVRMAAKVQDGRDGRGLRIRGTWNANERYFALDTVALNGGSFAARRDDPGVCPGDGWQMISAQGKRGPPGPKGDAGDRGRDGSDAPRIIGWQVDDKAYTIAPRFSNGTAGPVLELRKLFEQFLAETEA
jgi:hypothetical protein